MTDESNDTPMTKDKLLSKLVLDYLNDPEISAAYSEIDKWYG